MKLQLLLTTLLMLACSSVTAFTPKPSDRPSVKGSVISWDAEDGWHQVQRINNNDIVNLCEGGSSCDVAPGNYIVINHTTGERFTGITVKSPPEFIIEYSLDGNTFTFPSNAWYQVQNSVTYEAVCNGDTSCEVEPGNYIVINHTTGDRFENVLVETDSDTINVTGNTLSWPNDGWYQVQVADTYNNICNGGLSCNVPNGIYRVINHTTGERFENIQVRESMQADGPVLLTQLISGDLAFTSDLTFNEPRYQVIRSNEALNRLYFGALVPPCPACDSALFDYDFFNDSTVVLVAHEIVSSGGYSIAIESATVVSGRLNINVIKYAPGDNCATDDAFTGPFFLYKVDGVYDEVDFTEQVEVLECEQ